jgi:hypothetical protein
LERIIQYLSTGVEYDIERIPIAISPGGLSDPVR